MKIKGALWKKFYNDEAYWGNRWHDDTFILFDGVEVEEYGDPDDHVVVDVQSGDVLFEGEFDRDCSLTTFFTRWKKLQDTEVLVVTVDKEKAKELRAEIKKLQGVKEIR